MYKIALLFDETNNWISPYFDDFKLKDKRISFKKFYKTEKIKGYDVVFILGYTKILDKSFLNLNSLNLVVHESPLPMGKGFAPIQWQILEGHNKIPICLIEATENVDSGDIFMKNVIKFTGYELYNEIRDKQALATINIIKNFLKIYPFIKKKKQKGLESFYKKRSLQDSELSIDKSIRDQFNLLRIGNNNLWPSFFKIDGKKFVIKIYKSTNKKQEIKKSNKK